MVSLIPPSAFMVLSNVINLFFCFLVGQDGKTVYVDWLSSSSDFFS